jgi:hypothetical protein
MEKSLMVASMHPFSTRRKRPAPCQDAILEFMRDYKAAPENDGNSPTYEEIATALGVSVPAIYTACLRLVGHGTLRFNRSRKLVLGGKWIPPGEIDMD